MRIGIVAEGPTEHEVVAAVVRRLFPDSEPPVNIWPDTQVTGRAYGWTGVRSWCNEFGPKLEAFMKGVEGVELDLLVIHVDCSMAHNVEAARPCPPARDTSDALRECVVEWLGGPDGELFILLTPSLSSEAWLLAALDPPFDNLDDIECRDAEAELVRRRILRRRPNGQVKKPARVVRELVRAMEERWDRVREYCSEAERFQQELLASTAEQ